MFKTKPIMLLFLLFVGIQEPVFSREESDDFTDTESEQIQNQYGLKFDISYFEEISIGIGLSYGTISSIEHHFFGYSFGMLMNYRFEKDFYTLRPFIQICGGSGAILLGLSSPISTDFNTVTFGLSPTVGFSLFGIIDFYYRYNFYLDTKYNSHEIGLSVLTDFTQ